MKKNTFIALSLLFILLTQIAFAQNTKRRFQADYDVKDVRFGYFLGLTNAYFNVKFNNYFVNRDTLANITSMPSLGFKMGGLVNRRINDDFDVRVLPTVSLYSRKITYHYYDSKITTSGTKNYTEKTEARESAWFEIPAMIKYKSARRGNARMYIFAGMRYGVETNAVNRRRRQQFLTKTSDFSVEYGTGIEIFTEYFKFSPELHFSHGIKNLVNPVSNLGTSLQSVDRLTSHTITLYILFE